MSYVISAICGDTSSADLMRSIFSLGQNWVLNLFCAKEYDKISTTTKKQ